MFFGGLSASIVLSSERYLFLVYAVLNLGSTDNAFFDQYLLAETTLEHHWPSFFHRHVFLFHLPATFCRVVFQGLSVSIVIVSDRYLFLVNAVLNLGSTDDAFCDQYFLEETTLRTSLAFIFLYFTFQLHLQSCFPGIVCEYGDN